MAVDQSAAEHDDHRLAGHIFPQVADIVGPQRFQQQRGGSDAIHVIIPKDDHRFPALAGQQEPLHRRRHVRQQRRVRQILQARPQKAARLVRRADSAVDQTLRQQGRNPQVGGQRRPGSVQPRFRQ